MTADDRGGRGTAHDVSAPIAGSPGQVARIVCDSGRFFGRLQPANWAKSRPESRVEDCDVMAGHIEIGEPRRIPEGPNGRVILGIRPHGLDVHGVIDGAVAEAGVEMVTVLCGECGGGKRAWFGTVFESSLGPVALFEIVTVPKARSRIPRPAKAYRNGGGWRHRGNPKAPTRGYLLDEWHDELDGPHDVYCPAHGLKFVSFAELRIDVEKYRSKKRRKPVARVL